MTNRPRVPELPWTASISDLPYDTQSEGWVVDSPEGPVAYVDCSLERAEITAKYIATAANDYPELTSLIRDLQWSGQRRGPDIGPMGSGDGRLYPSCPICGGLQKPNGEFHSSAVGHRKDCRLGKLIRDYNPPIKTYPIAARTLAGLLRFPTDSSRGSMYRVGTSFFMDPKRELATLEKHGLLSSSVFFSHKHGKQKKQYRLTKEGLTLVSSIKRDAETF